MSGKYSINQGLRKYAVRVGLERGIYSFLADYALEMGMSLSSAGRRLIILGARCESEHGHVKMPMSIENITKPQKEIDYLLKDIEMDESYD